jgi:alpha-N-acetylglucosamine transferase
VEETVPIRIIFQNFQNFTVSEEFLFCYHNGFQSVENQSPILQFQALAQNETTFYTTSFRSETSSYTVLLLNENLEHKVLFEKTIVIQPRRMTETLKAITLVHLTAEDHIDENRPNLHNTLKISSGNSKPDKIDNIGFDQLSNSRCLGICSFYVLQDF